MFMARKSKVKNRTRRNAARKISQAVHERVKIMAALGHSEDRIARELNLHKNSLRARFVKSLDAGREIARAEAAAAKLDKLSVREQEMEDALNAGFGTEWQNPDGTNDLQHGAGTPAEAEFYPRMRGKKVTDEGSAQS